MMQGLSAALGATLFSSILPASILSPRRRSGIVVLTAALLVFALSSHAHLLFLDCSWTLFSSIFPSIDNKNSDKKHNSHHVID
jgi:hypothetical protein